VRWQKPGAAARLCRSAAPGACAVHVRRKVTRGGKRGFAALPRPIWAKRHALRACERDPGWHRSYAALLHPVWERGTCFAHAKKHGMALQHRGCTAPLLCRACRIENLSRGRVLSTWFMFPFSSFPILLLRNSSGDSKAWLLWSCARPAARWRSGDAGGVWSLN
jgi:hypothetical protein